MSAVKHKPATPLPWVVKANPRNLTVYSRAKDAAGQRQFVDEVPLESWGDEAPRLRKDLAYAFRAANAYPKLVAALNWYASTPDGGGVARKLLRELGELK